jgi:hypothetical protein
MQIALIALATLAIVAYAENPTAKNDLELSETKGRRYQYANYDHANTYGQVLQKPKHHHNNHGYNTYNSKGL